MTATPPERLEGRGGHLERARLLLDQSRPDLAESELRRALGQAPDDPEAHALLALCLGERRALDEAWREAAMAVRLAPDQPLGHLAMARVLLTRNQLANAELAARECLRLAPHDPGMHAVLAEVLAFRQDWKGSLAVAERGLALDPEHVDCANLRAQALVHLGRAGEAAEQLATTAALDPEDPMTHATQGWTSLHAGRHPAALEHFREALRLDPEMAWARDGMVEALKARYPLYGAMLRFLLWWSRQAPRMRLATVIGAIVVVRVARAVLPQPYDAIVAITYVVLVYLMWVTSPLFDLVLSLNRFGRLALPRQDLLVARLVGGCIAAGLALLAASAYSGDLLLAAAAVAVAGIPLSNLFAIHPDGHRVLRRSMRALGTTVLGLASLSVVLSLANGPADSGPGMVLAALALLVGLVSSWVGFAQQNRAG